MVSHPTVRALGDDRAHLLLGRHAPALRELLAAQLDGDDREARIHAATGLALRGDAHALAQLRRMSDEDGHESLAWNQSDHIEQVLAQRARAEPRAGDGCVR